MKSKKKLHPPDLSDPKPVEISIEDCDGMERIYDALVLRARRLGTDDVGEQMVSLLFRIRKRNRKPVFKVKRYFGPFTPNSQLIKDLKRIVGPTMGGASAFDLNIAVGKPCKVKLIPGETCSTIHVLDPRDTAS